MYEILSNHSKYDHYFETPVWQIKEMLEEFSSILKEEKRSSILTITLKSKYLNPLISHWDHFKKLACIYNKIRQ
jgi:hypothetical protein